MVPETGQPNEDAAHDVLAAEAFAMPARDPELNAGPVLLPDDPAGIPEPHDVLAAEEFPMPAPRSGAGDGGLGPVARVTRPKTIGLVVAALAAVAVVVRLLRRH